jgi:hypothetical protein
LGLHVSEKGPRERGLALGFGAGLRKDGCGAGMSGTRLSQTRSTSFMQSDFHNETHKTHEWENRMEKMLLIPVSAFPIDRFYPKRRSQDPDFV